MDKESFPELPVELYRTDLEEVVVVQFRLKGIFHQVIIQIISKGEIQFLTDIAAEYGTQIQSVSIGCVGVRLS